MIHLRKPVAAVAAAVALFGAGPAAQAGTASAQAYACR